MLTRALMLGMVSMLAACAAAVPGYTPPPFKESKTVEPMKSGDMDTEGAYHMSSQEKATDCKHLRGSILVTISRMKHREHEVGTSPFAIGANDVKTTIFGGSSKGLDRDAEHRRDRARIEAYNQHLKSKNCPTVDIEAELARPPE
jgi:hypothetical protein